MTLYHASTLCIDKPDVLHSRDNLDFGKGFYLTSLYEQAIRYSERFTRRGKEVFINVCTSVLLTLVILYEWSGRI